MALLLTVLTLTPRRDGAIKSSGCVAERECGTAATYPVGIAGFDSLPASRRRPQQPEPLMANAQ